MLMQEDWIVLQLAQEEVRGLDRSSKEALEKPALKENLR